MPAHLHGADRLEAPAVADPGGVHLTCQDVDPQQLGPVSDPVGAENGVTVSDQRLHGWPN
jgi:hypothetical protein